jgi:hypothetical protein
MVMFHKLVSSCPSNFAADQEQRVQGPTYLVRRFAPVAMVLAMLIGLADARVAQAGPVKTYQLKRLSLTNVNDAAGRWQFEGGQVYENGKHVGNYAVIRRVVFKGTDLDGQNTAMVTMTIFFLGGNGTPGTHKGAPQNLTVEGSHDFSSGDEIGSVSAASPAFAPYRDEKYVRKGDTVKIGP